MSQKKRHKDQLENIEYRSWVKAGLSLKYLKDGISDFAEEVAKLEHERVLQKLILPRGSSCNNCNLTTLKPAHAPPRKVKQCPIGQRHCNCLQNNTISCPNNICDRIYDEIVYSHVKRSPNWKNTDIKKWTTIPWEIAKCFINAPGYEGSNSADDTDVVGLMHLFINSTWYQAHMSCSIGVFDKIRDWRNSVFHTSSMELEDSKLTEGIKTIITILEDGKELKNKECSKQAVLNLTELQQEKFIITTESEAEVFRTAIAFNTRTTLDIKNKQSSLEQELRRKQEDDDRCQKKFQSELSDLQDRVSNLELSLKEEGILKPRPTDEQNVEVIQNEHLQKLENIIALKTKLRERYREKYKDTSLTPLKAFEKVTGISKAYLSPDMTKVKKQTCDTLKTMEYTEQINDYNDIFLSDGIPLKKICILGDIGSGKSTLCKMMIRNWCLSNVEKK